VTTTNSSNSKSGEANILFSYLTGLFTAILIFSLFFLFVGYKVGFSNLFSTFKNQIVPLESSPKVLSLPEDILKELTELKVPIDNTHNLTRVPKHDTYLVRTDKDLGFALRPDVRIHASMVRSTLAINVDPPVVYTKDDIKYSNNVKEYLKEQSLINYSYSTDSNGFRNTIPSVKSDRQILIIGDSVPFGVGVDDEHTVASQLQKIIGEKYRIINAGVGNYNGHQAFLMAKKLSDENSFAGLIYVACQNDFWEVKDWNMEAKDVLTKISAISNKFSNNVIVMLVTYMQYNLHDFFLDKGLSNERMEKTHLLRNALPKIAEQFGFQYHDWTDDVSDFMNKEKSIFSRFALYCDRAHLSPLGNRLMANELFSIIQHKWLINTEHPNN
jgi:lysophospholipase L1-like esterase